MGFLKIDGSFPKETLNREFFKSFLGQKSVIERIYTRIGFYNLKSLDKITYIKIF